MEDSRSQQAHALPFPDHHKNSQVLGEGPNFHQRVGDPAHHGEPRGEKHVLELGDHGKKKVQGPICLGLLCGLLSLGCKVLSQGNLDLCGAAFPQHLAAYHGDDAVLSPHLY